MANESSGKSGPQKAATLHDNTISPRDDRKFRGQALREAVPCESHAKWEPKADRPNPIDILEESNQGRITELLPLRYGRMLQSPFTFYRGAAAIMAADLATTPITNVRVQACGDCHLQNFGAFATPERNVIFDINDFDETLPAPWEWDVKRLAASFVLAVRNNNLKPKYEAEAARAVAQAYRERMAEFSRMSILDIWYAKVDWQNFVESTADEALQKKHKGLLKKAKKRTIQDYYFPKMTQLTDGGYVFKDTPPTIYHLPVDDQDDFKNQVLAALEDYKLTLQEDRARLVSRYRLADFAIKVVGIGSVGTMCAIALMLAPDDEPLVLQLKEARESVLEPYAGKSEFDNHGQRVVAGQRIVQSASDILLGWTKFKDGRQFYIRQLRDTKIKSDTEVWQGQNFVDIGRTMGSVLARAHARSGDAAVIAGYLGTDSVFEEAIAEFSLAYAKTDEQDHAQLVEAVDKGKIKVLVEASDE